MMLRSLLHFLYNQGYDDIIIRDFNKENPNSKNILFEGRIFTLIDNNFESDDCTWTWLEAILKSDSDIYVEILNIYMEYSKVIIDMDELYSII